MNKLDFEHYSYKGNVYKVLGTLKMKDPVSRKWLTAVHYRTRYYISISYVREFKDFMDKFKGVKDLAKWSQTKPKREE